MEISCAFPPAVDTPAHIALAERLGYRRAWCYDGPAIWGDVWMALARAAELTTTIELGPAVLVPCYRDVLVNATALASLAALAPGRVVAALGAGHGQAMLGRPGTRWQEVVDYLEALRALLRGEEVLLQGALVTMMHRPGFIAARPLEIPLLIAAEGPRGAEIARRLGDGIFNVVTPKAAHDWSAVLVWGTVLPDDDNVGDAALLDAAGPGAGAAYHITYYLAGPEALAALPGGDLYRKLLEEVPTRRRHLTAWSQHLVGLTDAEAAVLTPELVQQLTLTGTAAALRVRLDQMAAAGATEIVYQPAGCDIPGELTRFAAMACIPPRA